MSTTDPPAILDRDEGLRRLRGNVNLYRELVGVFLDDLPRLTGLLQQALKNGSAQELHYAAHCLKGSSGHLGADAVAQSAWQLEEMGRAGDMTHAESAVLQLAAELRRLTTVLHSIANETDSDDSSTRERPDVS